MSTSISYTYARKQPTITGLLAGKYNKL